MGCRRRAWLLALALVVSPARASQPPPSEEELLQARNEGRVEKALARCSAEAARRGEFRIVKVRFPYDLGETFSPTLTKDATRLERNQYWCVAQALKTLRLEPLPKHEYGSRDYTRDYGLGAPQALLPAGLVPAWQTAGKQQDRVEAALGSMLPPEITVTSDGCLWFAKSEPLAIAVWEWLHKRFGEPFGDLNEHDYALPGDWWLRHTTAEAESELCLDRLDAAAGAVRRHRHGLWQAAAYRSFRAEWVVNVRGGIAGDIGFCLRRQPLSRYTAAEAAALRQDVEKILRSIAYGAGTGMRRIALDWSENGRLETSVRPTTEPLDRLKVEAGCDLRRTLACTRSGGNPAFSPAARDALFRCVDEAHVDTSMVTIRFDISPDGAPENVVALANSPSQYVPARALVCLEAVIRQGRYAPSDGGPCSANGGLNWFIERPAPDGGAPSP